MTQLADWEKRLKPFFGSHLRIIGEIPLSEGDLDELADLVKENLDQGNFRQSTRLLTRNFPCSYLTLLAHFSAHNDQQGYWKTLANKLEIEHGVFFNSDWHKQFVNLAKKFGLKTFCKLDMDNFYVASIRYHGGIPTYSLNDFFERMVIPAIEKPGLRELPPTDALKSLINRPYLFVDKPVLDFLENSGEMGEAWFEACIRLVRHARENHGEVLASEEVPELPRYIHTFFEQFNEGIQEKGSSWRRPYLQVAPYSEDTAVSLFLPAQIIPLEQYKQQFTWQIRWPGLDEPILLPCQNKRQRQDTLIREAYFSIQAQAPYLTVSISTRMGETESLTELRRWKLPMLPAQAQVPLMAFRENWRQVANTQTLPAEPLYLLLPIDSSLKIEGDARRVETCPALVGAWKNWKIEFWDLSNALSILINQDHNPLGEVIPVTKEMAQPELVDGHLFDYQENPEQPLYTSGMPSIQVPIARRGNLATALAGWKVRINSIGEADPNCEYSMSLADFVDEVIFTEDKASLPLGKLLGEKPAGIYDVKINGPRGLKAEQRIRLWPRLLLEGYKAELPDPQDSDKPFTFKIRLQENAEILPQAGAEAIEILREDRVYAVSASADTRRVELDLVTHNEDGQAVRVPVSIPVARLRWALAEEKLPGELAFGRTMISISSSRFEQYESSALHVEMHGLGKMLSRLSCQLIEMDHPEQVLQEAKFYRTDFTEDWLRVGLGQFSDSVRSANAQLEFDLVYHKDWQSPATRYALMAVSPQLEISDARLEQDGTIDWHLNWHEERPLKHRRVMIKSAWKPWEKPIEVKIPDQAMGELLLEGISLPPSLYEVYFYIRRSWQPALTTPPEDTKPQQVELCKAEEMLAALETPGEGHDAQFQAKIERACIFDSLGEIKARDEAVSEAAVNLIHLQNVVSLVGSIKWIRSKNIEASYKSFFLKSMFKKELVETILQKYPLDDPNLLEYFHMIGEAKSVYEDTAKYLLEHVNDPIVISTCIKELIVRKNKDLAGILVGMIKDARLSNEDAISILSADPVKRDWALEQTCQLPRSQFTEYLIAGLLPGVIDQTQDCLQVCFLSAISRAILYETSAERVSQYLKIMINNHHPDAQETLILLKNDGFVDNERFAGLIEIDPGASIAALRKDKEGNQPWIKQIEEKYPQAAGIIKVGMALETPFGPARVERIKDVNNHVVDKSTLNAPGISLEMSQGEGLDRINAIVDFNTMAITFKGITQIYRCGICKKFIHPLRKALEQHKKKLHPYESLIMITEKGKIYFDSDEIRYTH